MAADSWDGPTTMAVQSVRSASRPEVRSSIELDLAVGVVEELADLLATDRIEGAGPGQVVDEEPVALVGGDPTGAGVGLGQKAVPLEGGHVRAHGGRGHAHAGGVHHVLGPDRLGRPDVLGDHGVEDGRLAGVELPARRGAVSSVRLSSVVGMAVLVEESDPRRPGWPDSACAPLALHSSEC